MNKEIESIEKEFNGILSDNKLIENAFFATESIMNVIECIVVNNGEDGWSNTLKIQGITQNDRNELEQSIKPHIDIILSFFNHKIVGGQIQGGIIKDSIPSSDKLQQLTQSIADPSKLQGLVTSSPEFQKLIPSSSGIKQLVASSPLGPILDLINIGDNELFNDAKRIFDDIDIFFKNFSRVFPIGTTRFVNSYDQMKTDPAPFYFLKLVPAPPNIYPFLKGISEIRIPARTIVFFGYILFDALRIILLSSSRFANASKMRNVLTLSVVFFDILKGDWKGSILTYIGVYGKKPMLIGTLIKIMITIYYYIYPLGSLDQFTVNIVNNIAAMFLAQMFETLAPVFMREIIKKSLNDIRSTFDPSADISNLSIVDNINFLRSIVSDPSKICSDQMKHVFDAMKMSPTLRVIMLLLNISEEGILSRCSS